MVLKLYCMLRPNKNKDYDLQVILSLLKKKSCVSNIAVVMTNSLQLQ